MTAAETAPFDAQSPLAIAERAADDLRRASGIERFDLALVLGSGWGRAAELIGERVAEVPADRVTGFHASGVPGHAGTLSAIRLASGGHALVIAARTHLYEGRGVAAVVHGVRTAAALGASTLVLTNGAGGVRPEWEPGTPVLISDHINLTGVTPASGPHFFDMTGVYTPRLRTLAHDVDPDLPEGVYVQFRGPQYETPAEVRMARAIGGELVGMSTALEAIAARQAGLDVLGLSLVTNAAAGVTGQPLSHQEVIDAGRAAEPRIAGLLARIIERMGQQQ